MSSLLGMVFAVVTLHGEPCTKPPIATDPFPDRMSAFVWRNWFCVPVERMAKVVGAKESDLTGIAAEMGLPPQPAVLPEWRTKGYITVVRRNWHLLPYDQLVELLNMTREEFAFCLKEDDSLFNKMGHVKPKCDRLAWSRKDALPGRDERKRIAVILKEEGIDDFSEEPRFAFVKELASTDPEYVPPSVADSPFDFRMIASYFADYGDPLGDPDVGSFPEGLLQKLSAEGINAVWMHVVLNTLVKDPKYPEFGKGAEARIANLKRLVARAEKYGIKVFLYLNEPRCLALAPSSLRAFHGNAHLLYAPAERTRGERWREDIVRVSLESAKVVRAQDLEVDSLHPAVCFGLRGLKRNLARRICRVEEEELVVPEPGEDVQKLLHRPSVRTPVADVEEVCAAFESVAASHRRPSGRRLT